MCTAPSLTFGEKTLMLFDCTANLVLQDTIERIFVQDLYADISRGIFLVRGENVLLLGEIVGSPFPEIGASFTLLYHRISIKMTTYPNPTARHLQRRYMLYLSKKLEIENERTRHGRTNSKIWDSRLNIPEKFYSDGYLLPS